ncbi:hypothetical protein [Nocardiopsis nanhaiensis]
MTHQPLLERVARRFPLVPRTTPACPPVGQRLEQIRSRAGSADTAAAALNLAALMASDCGMPELARELCLRQARVFLTSPMGFDAATAKLALQPLINLARLRTRGGHGDDAYQVLVSLFTAARAQSTCTGEGLNVDFKTLAGTADDYQEVVRWLWTVLLSDGSKALASAGRWKEALEQVRRHNGLGNRLFDGRQISILAHSTDGEHDQALALLADTEATEPWEQAVASVLTAFCTISADRDTTQEAALTTVRRYLASAEGSVAGGLFRTRLGLCAADLTADSSLKAEIITALVCDVRTTRDGHIARELLGHPDQSDWLSPEQHRLISEVAHRCGVAGHILSVTSHTALMEAAQQSLLHLEKQQQTR